MASNAVNDVLADIRSQAAVDAALDSIRRERAIDSLIRSRMALSDGSGAAVERTSGAPAASYGGGAPVAQSMPQTMTPGAYYNARIPYPYVSHMWNRSVNGSVTPLIGFPSPEPYVLNGEPANYSYNPYMYAPSAGAAMLPMMLMSMLGGGRQASGTGARGGGGGGGRRSAPAQAVPTPNGRGFQGDDVRYWMDQAMKGAFGSFAPEIVWPQVAGGSPASPGVAASPSPAAPGMAVSHGPAMQGIAVSPSPAAPGMAVSHDPFMPGVAASPSPAAPGMASSHGSVSPAPAVGDAAEEPYLAFTPESWPMPLRRLDAWLKKRIVDNGGTLRYSAGESVPLSDRSRYLEYVPVPVPVPDSDPSASDMPVRVPVPVPDPSASDMPVRVPVPVPNPEPRASDMPVSLPVHVPVIFGGNAI